MTGLLRTLGVLSALEFLSVVALLSNLVTVHDSDVARVLGPVHGALYLCAGVTRFWAAALRQEPVCSHCCPYSADR